MMFRPLPAAAPAPGAPAPRIASPPAVEVRVFEPAAAEAVEPAKRAEVRARPAGAMRRLAGWLVDLMVLGAVLAGTFALFRAFGRVAIAPPSTETGVDWLVDRLVAYRGWLAPAAIASASLAVAYTAVCTALFGRTLGGAALGTVVVDRRGQTPGAVRLVLRALVAVVGAAALLLGFWLAAFLRTRRALHDIVTQTYVVTLVR